MVESTSGLLGWSVLAAVDPSTGYYCDPIKIGVMLAFLAPWLYAAPRVQKDARRVHGRHVLWSLSVLGVGALTFFIWLLIPYVLGLLTYLILTGAVFLAYLVYRDGRVKPQNKVLTKEYITSLFQRSAKKKVQTHTRVKLYTHDGKIVMPPEGEDVEEAEINAYNRLQELLHDMIWKRVSQADLTPVGEQTRIRYVIDGVVNEQSPITLAESEAIMQFLKPIAGMDPEERRRPQEGQIAVDLAGQPIDITVATAGTTGGQRAQFRIIQESVRTRLNELGMDPDILQRVQTANKTKSGLIVVSGRSGMCVTSTLYSLLREHDAFIHQLVTLESTVEVDLENITQQAYGQPENLPKMLASMLRRDPEVVMVDRCPDPKTASIICEAAAEKKLILGMHASDTFVALAKWVKLCGDAQVALANLQLILCQILLRKLCPNCREAYRPDPELLVKANLAKQNIEVFYRPPTVPLTDEKGRPITCSVCQGSGYLGRTATFELLEITDALRQAVIHGASLTEIKKLCRRNKMLYLQEHALRKVIAGETSIQEVLRVSQQRKKK